MHFRKYGKTYQLRLETAADLAHVLNLDESLWVATSAPVSAFRCDPEFTRLLDPGATGRINTTEVRGAVKWLFEILNDVSMLTEERDDIPLAAIRKDIPGGEALFQSAEYVLDRISRGAAGKNPTPKKTEEADAPGISLGQVRSFVSRLRQQPLNGDGVIVPESASDPETAGFIADVLLCTGGTPDAGGKPGVAEANLREFREAVSGYLEWRDQADPAAGGRPEIMPLGSDTPALYTLFREHADKVDRYFELGRAIRFEPGAAARFGGRIFGSGNGDAKNAEDIASCLARAPLARPDDPQRLPLTGDDVNPFYSAWLVELRERVLAAVLNEPREWLTPDEWLRVKSAFRPYADYLARKKGACVEALPLEKLRRYRDGAWEQKALRIVAADRRVAEVLKGIHDLERLLLYRRHLLRFVNNFVNFSQLYAVDERALFEMGSAVMDGRWFNLAVSVQDLPAHTAAAKSSNMFTLYLEVTDRRTGQKFTVAVPATSGTKGNLVAGKRGVFFDTDGIEHDARIAQIIENPISLREALGAPFVKLWEFIVGKIEAMSGASEKELQKNADAIMQGGAASGKPGGASMPGGPAGLLVGVSLSVAAMGSAFAFITKTFFEMSAWQRLFGLAGAILVVLIPVMLIAVLKLRRQDLSSLLEGCGWAVNARMRLNRPLRRQFTLRVPYPAEATGTPKRRWGNIAAVVVLILLALAIAGRVTVRRHRAAKPAPEAAIDVPAERPGEQPPPD